MGEAATEEASTEAGVVRPAFLPWLVEENCIADVVAERVERVLAETGDQLCSVLLKLGLLTESNLADLLSRYSGLPRFAANDLPAEPLDVSAVNLELLRSREVVPVRWDSAHLTVACWDPLDDYVERALRFATRREVCRGIASRDDIRLALARLYPLVQDDEDTELELDSTVEDLEIDRLKDLASDAPVIRLVQRLIDEAVAAKASDIHLEPSEESLVVRFRLDGMLRPQATHAKPLAAPVVSRIKVMAGLDIAERRMPQDGRIRVASQGKEIDFRVVTAPTIHGESAVLRILDRQDVQLDFEALGFDAATIRQISESVSRPHGIVLVTGPTGSGKTTTLYAALKSINSPDRKILTVEDPVEYVLPGVNQVPLRPQIGLTFAHVLRSFLRQDPDVILVGEIRDRETAETAIQAALTGHLLLSTLHTNSASAAIGRLLDMGVDDFLLTSTLQLVLAQRLVRRLCMSCREAYAPEPALLKRFALNGQTEQIWHRAVGCTACKGTGYVGRTTIVESLVVTPAVREQVLKRADAHTIQSVAIQEGMRTMLGHGIERVLHGETSLDEVLRVTAIQ
jgi:general secretion pathway protein E